MEYTHKDLVKIARRWLLGRCRCKVVLTEFNIGRGEVPDAIGWRRRGRHSILVECKASRADFLVDKKKPFRKKDKGIGQEKLYMVPRGLVEADELPDHWGLLEVDGARRVHIEKRKQVRFKPRVLVDELPYMFKALQYYQLDPRIKGSNPMTITEKGRMG